MTHVDQAHLIELALGNAGSREDVAALRHMAVCGSCRDEMARIRRVVTAASTVEAADLPTAPPARVWERIRQELTETREPTARSVEDTTARGHRSVLGLLAAARWCTRRHRARCADALRRWIRL